MLRAVWEIPTSDVGNSHKRETDGIGHPHRDCLIAPKNLYCLLFCHQSSHSDHQSGTSCARPSFSSLLPVWPSLCRCMPDHKPSLCLTRASFSAWPQRHGRKDWEASAQCSTSPPPGRAYASLSPGGATTLMHPTTGSSLFTRQPVIPSVPSAVSPLIMSHAISSPGRAPTPERTSSITSATTFNPDGARIATTTSGLMQSIRFPIQSGMLPWIRNSQR